MSAWNADNFIDSIIKANSQIKASSSDATKKEKEAAVAEVREALKKCDDAMWEIVDALEDGVYRG